MPASVLPLLAPDAAGLARAAAILAQGGLVAFPTETVYGLGADARDDRAVAGIFAAKGRPRFNPLILHVADVAAGRDLCIFDARAERLAAAFWPGPLTLVLPLRDGAGISPLATAGLPLLCLRGASSDILTRRDFALMRRRRPDMIAVTVPGRGHVPFLDEPESLAALGRWLESLS